MNTLARLLPAEPPGSPKMRLRVAQAYWSLFGGSGSSDDAAIVQEDLAEISGFYRTTPAELPADQLKYAEGQRSVFGHVRAFLTMTPAARDGLEEAARGVSNEE